MCPLDLINVKNVPWFKIFLKKTDLQRWKKNHLHGYPAEPESAARGWGALQRGSRGHCWVPSPAHRRHTPALDSGSHTETQEQLMNNVSFLFFKFFILSFFLRFTEFCCFSITGAKTGREPSVETCRERLVTVTNNPWLLILQMINSLEINISSGNT